MEDTTKLLMECGNNIIKVLEKYKMTNAASTMRKEMATSKSKPNNDESLLSVIRKTVVNKEKKKLREETKQLNLHYKPLKADVDSSFNKEETEAIMEKLMNRIVANPKLFNGDDELNHKIEKIFNLEAFQKMVENADIFQDLSSSSIFSNSQILHKSMISQNTPMQQILQPASVNESSDIGDSHDFVDELIHKENEDSLLKIEKESMKTEHTRGGQKATKKRKDDKEPKSGGKAQPEKTHTTSHEEKVPMRHRESEEKLEDVKKVSDKIINELKSHQKDSKSTSLKFKNNQEVLVDEYKDDEDIGFTIVEVGEKELQEECEKVANQYKFPERSFKPSTDDDLKRLKEKKQKDSEEEAKRKALSEKRQQMAEESRQNEEAEGEDDIPSMLPKWVKFPPCEDDFYPAEFNGVVYDCYNLKVVFDREKTGFEETREFQIVYNSIIAGRYQVMEYLGSAAFSKAIRCYDLHTNEEVCMKIIENNKDYYDQSIDEIKLLRYVKTNCDDCDEKYIIKMIDYFYHKEHLFIVTELLKDNLYEFYKYNREQEEKLYFTLGRLQQVTKQILISLDYLHSLNLIHCDLKPENILIKSYSKCQVKVIDLGSSCFIHDHLSSYVQSRSYRAPEVILGCKYDYKVDIWSLGCIVAELFTGYVLFQNESVVGLLARVLGIIGPIPEHMVKEGKLVSNFFTKEGILYQEAGGVDMHSQNVSESTKRRHRKKMKEEGGIRYNLLIPKKTHLKARLNKIDDEVFIDFLTGLLQIDPDLRLSAKEALNHPWITQSKYPEDEP